MATVQDNRPMKEQNDLRRQTGFGLGKDEREAMKVPGPPVGDRWVRVRWWLPTIWVATSLLLVLSVIFLSYAVSTQSRTITMITQQVGEMSKQIGVLNKLALDLSTRVEAIERAPKVVPTSMITPTVVKPEVPVQTQAVHTNGPPPPVDAVSQRELGELKLAVQAQGEKLDAVLEGLKGVRRRR